MLAIATLLAGLCAASVLHAQTGERRGGFDSSSQTDGPIATPILIYYPPNPPPLGRAIARGTSSPDRGAAPAELAAYVNELFYPPLGTRLTSKTLNARLRAQLDAYRTAKQALQLELRAELDRVRDADAATRTAAFTALAQRQAAKIAELESVAEQLRRDLITSDQSWNALRQWRLGDNDRRGFSPLEIAQVMRGYAFYQPGLIPAQRRLLREISIELTMAGDTTTTATAQQPYLFFPPEPARVLLPDDLPGDVAAKLADYQTKKSLLKKELYDAVYARDSEKLGFLRGNTLKTLADKQAAALAALDTLAEEIRRGIASTADPAKIAERSPLPPVLHHRVAVLMGDYATAQKEASARIEAILAENKELPMLTNFRLDGDGLKFIVMPSRGSRGGRGGPPPETLSRIEDVRARISAIADDYGQRIAALINERDAIRAEISRTLGKASAASTDNALQTAMRVVTAKETEGLYGDYRIAVFQPGLSPGQRRLLFDSVMEQLDLPLPRGEPQTMYRANSW